MLANVGVWDVSKCLPPPEPLANDKFLATVVGAFVEFFWWVKDVTGFSLFFSPNLVWLLVALADYFVFPYDMATAGRDDFFTNHRLVLGWLAWRAAVNSSITFGYFGFWHVTLYWLGWAERPFKANRAYRWSKVLHNMWFTLLGALQYSHGSLNALVCGATNKQVRELWLRWPRRLRECCTQAGSPTDGG